MREICDTCQHMPGPYDAECDYRPPNIAGALLSCRAYDLMICVTGHFSYAIDCNRFPAGCEACYNDEEGEPMKTRHTPGPWITASTGNHQRLVISERTGANVAVAYNGEADSALIAAAPDLLAACQETLETLREMTTEEYQRGGDKHARELLEAAIRKAEAAPND
jgi:hypothetical protein